MTKFNNNLSPFAAINASVVQGSAIGPMCFILNMTGLQLEHSENSLSEYADDCYLIVPSNASHTISEELDHISKWASSCNLKLNKQKTKEIILCQKKFSRNLLPPPLPGIERLTSICVLGVTFDESFSFCPHIDSILSKGHQRLYALKTLKAHGLSPVSLSNVTSTILFPLLTYACSAWWGFLSSSDLQRLNSLLRKTSKWNLLNNTPPTFQSLCEKSDSTLFKAIISNHNHALHHLLPPVKISKYNLRNRPHNRTLPLNDTALNSKNFLNRMLYKDIY